TAAADSPRIGRTSIAQRSRFCASPQFGLCPENFVILTDVSGQTLRGGGRLLFATNAGMFDPALKPVGLYVEQGRELVHVNTTSGYGNFHMKPNGVFYVSGDRAAVVETRAFLKHRPQADLATQSGPMLVINGRLHPRFDRSSRSLKARTGVGVRADGEV